MAPDDVRRCPKRRIYALVAAVLVRYSVVLCLSVCLCVCHCVTGRYCIETAERVELFLAYKLPSTLYTANSDISKNNALTLPSGILFHALDL